VQAISKDDFFKSLSASQVVMAALKTPAPLSQLDDYNEETMNDELEKSENPQSTLTSDDTPSKVFWSALAKVVPIASIKELMYCEDKSKRTAAQHLKDMNLSKSYRKLLSLTGRDGCFDVLLDALIQKNLEKFCLILEIDIDQVFTCASIDSGQEGGCTIFHSAAKYTSSSEYLDALAVKLGPKDLSGLINTSSHLPWKNTALHHAARLGNIPVITKLTELGALTSKTNGEGHTPMEVAAKYSQFEAFVALCSLKKSQRVVVSQTLSDLLKGMDKKYLNAIADHNSNCDRAGIEQRQADFEAWRFRTLQEIRLQNSTLFNVIDLSQKEPDFGRAILLDFAVDEKESISRIKRGKFESNSHVFDVLSPSVFDKSDIFRPHSQLFKCIGFTLSNVASLIDVEEKLSEYESSCHDASKSALYFVAWARMAAMRRAENDAFLQHYLLARFIACCDALNADASEWLSPTEIGVASKDPMDVYCANPVNITEESGHDASHGNSWLEKLSDSQRAPFDKLSKLVGLESIKKDAKWMYDMALSQKENQRLGVKSSTIERLNFTFLGNPGTGKTTVASIVAQILHQSGARGPVFDKMTGPEALAMGSKEFCARLSKLTGDTKSQAPPPTFRKGIQVEMCWSDEMQGPDIDSFRKFSPATESATVLSFENSSFMCDRSIPLCKGDFVQFIGALPDFLKNDASYTIQEALGSEFSLSNLSGAKERFHVDPFQVQWQKCLRGVSVKPNYVFHCASHHHLEPNFPIRFASNVGDKIAKNSRVYVKRVIDAFSFTVSLSISNRDKAETELQAHVAPAELEAVYVDNLPQSQVAFEFSQECYILIMFAVVCRQNQRCGG
jgi:hypothetical protein